MGTASGARGRRDGDGGDGERVLVWDWPTRVFHWALGTCVLGSWITATAFDLLEYHMLIGYVTLGLLAFRLLWGFVGPRHARFSSFVTGPRRVFAYLRDLPRRSAPMAAGHNPLGGLAVVVMLALLAVQAGTGLFASDDLFYLGPYNGAVSGDLAEWLTSVHKSNSDLLLVAIWVHIGAIAWYAFGKRQNLVGPMITGRKRLRDVGAAAAIASARGRLAVALALLVAFAVWLLVTLAPPPPPPGDGLF